MRHRIAAAVVALLTLSATATVLAQGSRFPDARPSDLHYEDIEWVSAPSRGYFGGFADGTFGPDRAITPEQMAKVLSRLPDNPITRAEFASFIVGGLQRMRAMSTTTTMATTTTAPPRAQSKAWTGSCEEMYAAMVLTSYNELGYPEDYNFTPLKYSSGRDTLGYSRFRTFQVDITRITGWYERFVTPTIVLCQGDAKLDNGHKLPIIILSIVDADGDGYFNYRFPAGDQPTCRTADRNGWTVIRYNVTYLYGSARDSDGDKIMCENVLEEDELQIVGNVLSSGAVSLSDFTSENGRRAAVVPQAVRDRSRIMTEGEGRPWF